VGASIALVIATAIVLLMAVAVAFLPPGGRKQSVPVAGAAEAETGPAPPVARLPIAAEVLGYAGGALAAASIAAMVVEYWEKLAPWAHVVMPAIVAVLALACSWALDRLREKGASRLAEYLLLVSVGAASATVGLAVYHLLRDWTPVSVRAVPWLAADDWAWFTGSLTIAVLGGILWWHKRNVARHLVFGLGVAATSITVLMLPNTTGPDWIVGTVLAGVGVVWLALSMFELLPPKIVGLTLGTLGILGGVELAAVMPFGSHMVVWALWLGIALSVGFVVASILLRQMVFLGLGAAGVVVFVPELLSEAFGKAIGVPIVLLVAGVLLLVAGVAVAVLGRRMRATPA